ncbi:uncharacterized protein LOC123315357 [Coccinella septempunctata]|uniref:uncharacterized protein LOC123315357 n=1 Tax=Coccinella septempunctata TaxID=41139 RepID=UPI001D07C188|nr:uncharacterized protein LOC123315357 [Coccinella septempunctata]
MNQMAKPPEFPNMPLKKTRDLKALEEKLDEPLYADYLRKRLATLGGTTIKHATTNMMKFLLTNRCARKFSWAGQKSKQSFQSLKCCRKLIEAVYVLFESETPADLNDAVIKRAIQDWLRLANQRYEFERNKNK